MAGSYYYQYGPGFYPSGPSQPQRPYSSGYMSYPSHLPAPPVMPVSNLNMPFHNTTQSTPQIPRPILSNTTATVVNAPSQTVAKPTRKRKQAPTTSTLTQADTQKRRNTGSTSISTPASGSTLSSGTVLVPPEATFIQPAVYGVGPVSSSTSSTQILPAASAQLEHTHFGSILSKSRLHASNQVASDVWYCVRPLDVAEKPSTVPENEEILKERPKAAKFVGCRLCL